MTARSPARSGAFSIQLAVVAATVGAVVVTEAALSVAFDADHSEAGRAATKAEAISEAERAIDRALAPKKTRLVPPPRRWD